MLTIYTENITSRLSYALYFICTLREIPFQLTDDPIEFKNALGNKLNYSDRNFESICSIKPAALLFDKQISTFGIENKSFNGEECIAFNGITDPLASIFYVLSRYEEYTSRSTDKFDRFEAANSILYRFGWLERVVCDRWAEAIINYLNANGNQISFKKPDKIHFLPTFDIDNAFAYLHKGIYRTLMAIVKDFLYGNSKRLIERQKVQLGQLKDPYDTYNAIFNLHDKGFDLRIFWLLADFNKHDRNIHYKQPFQRKLIQHVNKKIRIGIHPGMQCVDSEFELFNEIDRLEQIVNHKISDSRQHYLMLKFPNSYRMLVSQHITDDYTMGFADIAGFRAGTARPFLWFDLKKNEVTPLTVHPFSYMDGTLKEYMKLTPNEAIETIKRLHAEVKNYGGEFSFIWHNETIGNYGAWKGWREVFEYTIQLAEN